MLSQKLKYAAVGVLATSLVAATTSLVRIMNNSESFDEGYRNGAKERFEKEYRPGFQDTRAIYEKTLQPTRNIIDAYDQKPREGATGNKKSTKPQTSSRPNVHDTSPDIRLPGLDGMVYCLSDYNDK